MTDTRPVCMITGVGEGIGGHAAKRFAKSGYRIAMLARSVERLERLEKELDGSKGYECDVSDLDSLVKKYNQKISCVLSLNVEKEYVVKRILGRQTCAKCGSIFNKYFIPATKKNHSCDSKFLHRRLDDNEKTIINRFETYLDKTLPIIDFYRRQNLFHQINIYLSKSNYGLKSNILIGNYKVDTNSRNSCIVYFF